MNNPFTFEIEEFESSSDTEQRNRGCGCKQCQAKQEAQEFEQDEMWDELELEAEQSDEASWGQVPWPAGGTWAGQPGPGVYARGPATAGNWLNAEKTCWVQNVLNRAEGESLKTDGIFGPLTRAAVVRFQSRQSLKVDGIVGPQTETALIQTALNNIAKASLLPVDGVRSARTTQEVRRFQTERRLVVDGVVGPQTRAAIIVALGGKRCPVRAMPRRPSPRPPTPWPPTPQPPVVPPPPTGCDKAELSRRVDACIADTKRCAIEAGQDLALALAACKLNPLCNAAAVGKSLLAMKRCREALLRCDAAAKAATNCI